MTWEVRRGDCIEAMRDMPEASVAAIVTDPPYGLGFMGREWDALPPGLPWARECLRVLKPGGHLLAFGGTRTYHRLACAVEDAGFEIRDCLAWLYGSGFPKSLDVSKAIDKAAGAEREVVGSVRKLDSYGPANEVYGGGPDHERAMAITAPATPDAERWQGWGTALKPAHEPIVMARKPLVGTVAGNVLAHGTGALNVDGCRIAHDETLSGGTGTSGKHEGWDRPWMHDGSEREAYRSIAGRWPANVLLDEQAAAMLDEQTGDLHSQDPRTRRSASTAQGVTEMGTGESVEYDDRGGASRFLYVAKASSAERNAGLDAFPECGTTADGYGSIQTPTLDRSTPRKNWTPHPVRNFHPTVKPIDLMRWLVRLVASPAGTVLDPFAGSGTTGIAAVLEGFDFIGIEREPEYADIAEARIRWWEAQPAGIDVDDALAGNAARAKVADAGQLDMLGGG